MKQICVILLIYAIKNQVALDNFGATVKLLFQKKRITQK